MRHSFPAYLGLDDLNPAFFTDNASVLHAFVFTAVTLVILHWPKDLGAKKAVSFGLESTIVNGLGLFHLTVRPLRDLLGAGQRYPNR